MDVASGETICHHQHTLDNKGVPPTRSRRDDDDAYRLATVG